MDSRLKLNTGLQKTCYIRQIDKSQNTAKMLFYLPTAACNAILFQSGPSLVVVQTVPTLFLNYAFMLATTDVENKCIISCASLNITLEEKNCSLDVSFHCFTDY